MRRTGEDDANGMRRRPASRTLAPPPPATASTFRHLYSACSRLTCCLTRKSEVG